MFLNVLASFLQNTVGSNNYQKKQFTDDKHDKVRCSCIHFFNHAIYHYSKSIYIYISNVGVCSFCVTFASISVAKRYRHAWNLASAFNGQKKLRNKSRRSLRSDVRCCRCSFSKQMFDVSTPLAVALLHFFHLLHLHLTGRFRLSHSKKTKRNRIQNNKMTKSI